jgi:hypothetical protein
MILDRKVYHSQRGGVPMTAPTDSYTVQNGNYTEPDIRAGSNALAVQRFLTLHPDQRDCALTVAPNSALDFCPTCNRRITDMDDEGCEMPDGQRWCLKHRPTPAGGSAVVIPGIVVAAFKDGEVNSITFAPLASDAGYFGPAAVVTEGDADLDVTSTDGSFWRAVQAFLQFEDRSIEWVE